MSLYFSVFVPIFVVGAVIYAVAAVKAGTTRKAAGVGAFLVFALLAGWSARLATLGYQLLIAVPLYALATGVLIARYRRACEEEMGDSGWFVATGLLLLLGLLLQVDFDVTHRWWTVTSLWCRGRSCSDSPPFSDALTLYWNLSFLVPMLYAFWKLKLDRLMRSRERFVSGD